MERRTWMSVFSGAGILAIGAGGMLSLAALKKPPAQATSDAGERGIRVETLDTAPVDATVTVSGFGEVRSVRTVQIASQVSGTVTQTHARLVTGEFVRGGELLFALDARPYEATLEQARARIAECDTQLRRLAIEQKNESERLTLLRRTEELARARFDRASRLHAEAIGNQTEVDEAERALNDAVDASRLLEREVALYPVRLEEAVQQKTVLEAALKQAELNLGYASVYAPFDCRIAEVKIEEGQFLSSGQSALVLADDSALEVAVKLDATEARTWLRFDHEDRENSIAWFESVEPVVCEVRWVEDADAPPWRGVLDRVERFDPQSRTVAVVVRVSAPDAHNGTSDRPPLVAGMFCEARIPGRTISDVYRLPEGVLTLDRTVRIARGGRLASVPVDVLRQEDGQIYVRAEFGPGDKVITTRLLNPTESSLLELAAAHE